MSGPNNVINEITNPKRFVICEYYDTLVNSVDIDLETTDDYTEMTQRLTEIKSEGRLVRAWDCEQLCYIYPVFRVT